MDETVRTAGGGGESADALAGGVPLDQVLGERLRVRPRRSGDPSRCWWLCRWLPSRFLTSQTVRFGCRSHLLDRLRRSCARYRLRCQPTRTALSLPDTVMRRDERTDPVRRARPSGKTVRLARARRRRRDLTWRRGPRRGAPGDRGRRRSWAYRFRLGPRPCSRRSVAAAVLAAAARAGSTARAGRWCCSPGTPARSPGQCRWPLVDGAAGLTRSLLSPGQLPHRHRRRRRRPARLPALFTADAPGTRWPPAATRPGRCCCCGRWTGPGCDRPPRPRPGCDRGWRADCPAGARRGARTSAARYRPAGTRRCSCSRRTRSGSRSAIDAVVAVLGAAGLLAGGAGQRRAPHRARAAAPWALAAAPCSAWPRCSPTPRRGSACPLVCLYFARRRAALNVVSGIGALAAGPRRAG